MSTDRETRSPSDAALQLLEDIRRAEECNHRPVFRMGRARALFESLKKYNFIDVSSRSRNFGEGYVITPTGRDFISRKEAKGE